MVNVLFAGEASENQTFVNSIGMKFIHIEPGSFMMGLENEVLPEAAGVRYFPGRYKQSKLPPAAGWKGYRPGLVAVIYNSGLARTRGRHAGGDSLSRP
jgi:hypothetical protein